VKQILIVYGKVRHTSLVLATHFRWHFLKI